MSMPVAAMMDTPGVPTLLRYGLYWFSADGLVPLPSLGVACASIGLPIKHHDYRIHFQLVASLL